MRCYAFIPLVIPGNSVVSALAVSTCLQFTLIGCFAVRFEIRFAGLSFRPLLQVTRNPSRSSKRWRRVTEKQLQGCLMFPECAVSAFTFPLIPLQSDALFLPIHPY